MTLVILLMGALIGSQVSLMWFAIHLINQNDKLTRNSERLIAKNKRLRKIAETGLRFIGKNRAIALTDSDPNIRDLARYKNKGLDNE